MSNLFVGLQERALEATVQRHRDTWYTVWVGPDAVIFHTPEQLRAFVREEIRRAFAQNQIPNPEEKNECYTSQPASPRSPSSSQSS